MTELFGPLNHAAPGAVSDQAPPDPEPGRVEWCARTEPRRSPDHVARGGQI